MLRFDRKQQNSVKQSPFNKIISNNYNKKRCLCLNLRKLKQGLFINLEGWDGEGDGRKVQKGGDICIPMADSC